MGDPKVDWQQLEKLAQKFELVAYGLRRVTTAADLAEMAQMARNVSSALLLEVAKMREKLLQFMTDAEKPQ